MKNVLMTGMTGLIGGLLRSHLESLGGYQLSALNRRPIEGVKCTQADISDLEAIKPAFVGIDVVVHLAAQLPGGPWESLLRTNLVGTYNVFEAARLAGVSRVVFASTGDTIRGWEREAPYGAIAGGRYGEAPEVWPIVTHEMVRPAGIYGASKVWGEALARHFTDVHYISILCLRLGAVLPGDRPTQVRHYSTWLSHRDAVDIFHRCIEAPEGLKYDIFLVNSNNRWGYRDLEHPRRALGFVPQDSAEDFREPPGPQATAE